jgi:hypothetical protein
MRRMCDAEGGVAELKNEHGMDRARCRGTSLFHVQLLLGCTALNVKRIAGRTDAASGQAASPATAQATDQQAAADGLSADSSAQNDPAAARMVPSPIVHAARATWTVTLSMN